MLMSLAFLPPDNRTWIGELRRNGNNRKKPLFSITTWNYYQVVIEDDLRSNNGVEGWHHSFNKKVGVNHEIFSALIRVIKAEQVITETNILQINTGANVITKRRKIYADKDERLKKMVEQSNNDDHTQQDASRSADLQDPDIAAHLPEI
ncbi:uncharacterized protein LOC130676899 [Microplitis mediator]|uniref:uncharacterized protein LOC130676899 n=1 Tax=Microplitis mediator TaxID=375433 RepID=UPI00255535A1|nr:uncharacterized protein LOC130676899 [Microplitis mediator]